MLTIARAAIEQASPRHLLARALQEAAIASRLSGRALRVVAVGKAAPFMAQAFAEHAHGSVRGGLVIGTHLRAALPAPFTWIQSSHPLPDERSVAAGAPVSGHERPHRPGRRTRARGV